MSKEKIKQSVRQAIKTDPNKKDIVRISLFGSHAYGRPKADSDVDLLIEFKPKAKIGFFELFDTRDNLEKHLNKKVDLLTPGDLSKYFRDEVLKKAEKIYERK